MNRETNAYTAEQLDMLQAYLQEQHDPMLYPFLFSAHYGLRLGEACAVRWSDLDLENGILHVRGNMSGRPAVFDRRLKTSASRADLCLLPGDTRLLLDLQQKRQDLGMYALGMEELPETPIPISELDKREFVCWDTEGNLSDPLLLNKRFKELLARLGLPNGSWHDLRHSYGTRLLGAGLNITDMSKATRQGANDTTFDIYAVTHTMAEIINQAGNDA